MDEPLPELMRELESVGEAAGPLLELHRAAFERVLDILRREGRADLIDRLLEDPLLGSVLRGYGLVEVDLAAKVRSALEAAGLNALLIRVQDGVAYLELLGPTAALRETIGAVLYDQVPELCAVNIGGTLIRFDHD